jgi:hypothetical protein
MDMTSGTSRGNLVSASQAHSAPEAEQNRQHGGEEQNARPGLHFNEEEFEARERFLMQEARRQRAEEKLATQGPSFQQRVQQSLDESMTGFAALSAMLGPQTLDTRGPDLRQVLNDINNRNPPLETQLRNMDFSDIVLVSANASPDSDGHQASQPPQKESGQ